MWSDMVRFILITLLSSESFRFRRVISDKKDQKPAKMSLSLEPTYICFGSSSHPVIMLTTPLTNSFPELAAELAAYPADPPRCNRHLPFCSPSLSYPFDKLVVRKIKSLQISKQETENGSEMNQQFS